MVLSSLVRWGHRLCSNVRRNHGLGSLPGWEEGSAQQSGRAIGWALLLCRVVGWALQWAVPSAALGGCPETLFRLPGYTGPETVLQVWGGLLAWLPP